MKKQRALTSLFVYSLLLGVSLIFLIPVWMMLAGSFKPDDQVLLEAGTLRGYFPANISLQNYQDVFHRVPFLRYLCNSLLITSLIVITGLLVNSLAGYALARLRWPGRDWILLAIIALMIIPLEAIAVPLFYEVTLLGWRDTYLVQILTFLTQWGSFLWPLMVTHSEDVRPLPLGIAAFYTLPPLQWGDIFSFGVMMVSPVLLVFMVFQRWFVQGVATTGVKG